MTRRLTMALPSKGRLREPSWTLLEASGVSPQEPGERMLQAHCRNADIDLLFVRADDVHDAFVDVERREDGVHVLRAQAVRSISLDPGALGSQLDPPPRIAIDAPDGSVTARWGPSP